MFSSSPELTASAGLALFVVSFLSWIGAGHLIFKALRLLTRPPAWLTATVGCAALMLFGGVLALFGLISP